MTMSFGLSVACEICEVTRYVAARAERVHLLSTCTLSWVSTNASNIE